MKCPRCESTNTKFCYYNNYNKSQPRHFCKGCKRHWTQGGLLRTVPVGGGTKRKSRDGNRAGQSKCRVSSTLSHNIFNPICQASITRPLKITSTCGRDGNRAGQNKCKENLTLSHNIFNSICHAPITRPLKITSTCNRDGNQAGQDECKIFNPPHHAPTISGMAREKSTHDSQIVVVVQSKENYDQNFPLMSNNNIIDEEKNRFDDNFPSSSLQFDTIDNIFKGSIDTIPCSISTSTTSPNIYNYIGNLDSTILEEESTITWQVPIRSSVMDNLSNYWNWDDMETLISYDGFDISWDDKP